MPGYGILTTCFKPYRIVRWKEKLIAANKLFKEINEKVIRVSIFSELLEVLQIGTTKITAKLT